MKKFYLLFVFAVLASMAGMSAATKTAVLDFEGNPFSGTWVNDGFAKNTTYHNSGAACAETGGKTKASLVSDISYPSISNISFSISKASTNDKSAIYNVYTSADGTTWNLVGSSPNYTDSSIKKGEWTPVSIDVSNVTGFVKVEYNGNAAIRLIDDIVVTYEEAEATELTAPVIEVDGSKKDETTYYGSANVTISYPDLATSMTYTVTKDGVAAEPVTVTAAAELPIAEVGSYKIEATATDGTNTLAATPVEFTIIEKPAAKGVFEKLLDAATLKTGDRIIILAEGSNVAMAGDKSNKRDKEDVTLDASGVYEVGFESKIAIFTLGGASGAWTLTDDAGSLSVVNDGTNITTGTAASTFTIDIAATGDAKIVGAQGRMILYSKTANVFGNYSDKNENATGYTKVQIYKEKIDPSVLVAPAIAGVDNGAVYYEEAKTVSITCPTEGASIYYVVKRDGTAIEENANGVSPVELKLSEVGLYEIEAMATKGEEMTDVVTISFTIASFPFERLDPLAVKEGTYMIAAKSNDGKFYIMRNEVFSTNYVAADAYDMASGNVSADTKNLFFVEKADGGYYIKNFDKTYVALQESGTYINLKPQETTPFVWTFAGTKDAVQATGAGLDAYMQFKMYKESPEFVAEKESVSPMFLYINDETSGVDSMVAGTTVKAVAGGIEVTVSEAAEVNVYTAAGQVVSMENVAEGTTTVSVPAGFYIVRAGNTVAKVIVK